MEDFIRMVFAFMGVMAVLTLIYIDRRYPGENPIDTAAYRIIGGYIVFVFAGPRGVRRAMTTFIDKLESWNFSDFTISFGGKNDKTKKD